MQDITIYDENNQILNYVTQWDSNVIIHILASDLQGITIDSACFFNARSERALVTEVELVNGYYVTNIPNILLEESSPVFGYTNTREIVGGVPKERAYFRFYITVRKMPQPSDRIYIYNNTQDYVDAITMMEELRQDVEDAEIYAERAEQAARQSGYMYFYIDENGDLIYERTTNVRVDFAIVDGDLILSSDVI